QEHHNVQLGQKLELKAETDKHQFIFLVEYKVNDLKPTLKNVFLETVVDSKPSPLHSLTLAASSPCWFKSGMYEFEGYWIAMGFSEEGDPLQLCSGHIAWTSSEKKYSTSIEQKGHRMNTENPFTEINSEDEFNSILEN